MTNVIPFRPRTPRIEPRVATPIPFYRLSGTRAKALGVCPEPANDTRTSGSRATRRKVTAENGKRVDDRLASLVLSPPYDEIEPSDDTWGAISDDEWAGTFEDHKKAPKRTTAR